MSNSVLQNDKTTLFISINQGLTLQKIKMMQILLPGLQIIKIE